METFNELNIKSVLDAETLLERATSPVFCHTELKYYSENNSAPKVRQRVEIKNARVNFPGTWQDCGFELLQHTSAVKDWQQNEINNVYCAEIAAIAKKMTGCDYTLLNRYFRRSTDLTKVSKTGAASVSNNILPPLNTIHSDFTDDYGTWLQQHYQSNKPEIRQDLDNANLTSKQVANAKRIVVMQFWRNLGPPTMDMPLALCDARTIEPGQPKIIDIKNHPSGGIIKFIAPEGKKSQLWYAYPDLSCDEVIAIRTFDSALVGQAYWPPHTAFADPMVERGQPYRSSLELRVNCLFL